MSVMRGSFLGGPLPFPCAIVEEVVENCREALGWSVFWIVDVFEVLRVGERRMVWRRGVRRRKRGDTCCCAIVMEQWITGGSGNGAAESRRGC